MKSFLTVLIILLTSFGIIANTMASDIRIDPEVAQYISDHIDVRDALNSDMELRTIILESSTDLDIYGLNSTEYRERSKEINNKIEGIVREFMEDDIEYQSQLEDKQKDEKTDISASNSNDDDNNNNEEEDDDDWELPIK